MASETRSGNYITYQRRDTKAGKPRWRALVRYKGQVAVSKTAPRKADLEKWASRTLTDMTDQKFNSRHEAESHTVADLVDRYKVKIENDAAKQKAGQPMQLDWFASEIGNLTLAELTPAVLAECRDKLALEKSNPTSTRYLASLSRALTIAVKEWGWLEDNPLRNVERKPENQGRVRFLTDDERNALLQACQESAESALYPIVVLALATGMRQGEILGLTWGDIDLQSGWITLHATKNKDRRGLPLIGHALVAVKAWQGYKVRHMPTAPVFPGLDGSKGTFRLSWNKAVKEAELSDFKFHDLRHSAATALLKSGANLREIADVLGHRTLSMVMRYSHVGDDQRAKVVGRMNEAMFGEGK